MRVRRLRLFAVTILILLASCDQPVDRIAPPLGQVTEVRISVGGNNLKTVKTIRDHEAISRIVAFVDARSDLWKIDAVGVPVAQVAARFYDGDKYKGFFGAGRSFFETNRVCLFCSRNASSEEVRAFLKLVEMDESYLR
jgi:hypothetical protein